MIAIETYLLELYIPPDASAVELAVRLHRSRALQTRTDLLARGNGGPQRYVRSRSPNSTMCRCTRPTRGAARAIHAHSLLPIVFPRELPVSHTWQAAVQRARDAVLQDPAGSLELRARRELHHTMLTTLGLEAQHDFALVVGLRAIDAALASPGVLVSEEPRQDLLTTLRVLLRVADRRMAVTTAVSHANTIGVHALDWMGRGDRQQFALRVAYRTLLSLRTSDAPPEERDSDRAWDAEAWDLPFCASIAATGGTPWGAADPAAVAARRDYWLDYLRLASEAPALDWVEAARKAAQKYGVDADRSAYKGGLTYDAAGNELISVLDVETSERVCEVPVCRLDEDAGVVVIEVEKLTRNLSEQELASALKAALVDDLLREDFEEPYSRIRVTSRDTGKTWELSVQDPTSGA